VEVVVTYFKVVSHWNHTDSRPGWPVSGPVLQ